MASRTRKTTRKRRKNVNFVAKVATITLTSDEAQALLGGIGAALRNCEPPKDVAPHLSTAIEKFFVAFGIDTPSVTEAK